MYSSVFRSFLAFLEVSRVQWVGTRENMEKTRFPSSGGLGSQTATGVLRVLRYSSAVYLSDF